LNGAIDNPLDARAGPVDGIGVESTLRVRYRMVDSTVIGCCVSLSEVVGLYSRRVSTKPFPVDLIKIIRLHHKTADDTSTVGCLRYDLDITEEDVVIAGDRGGVGLGVDDEFGTVVAVSYVSSIGEGEGIA